MDLEGTIFGKPLYRYDPGIECTRGDLRNLISRSKRIETLRTIAQWSYRLFTDPDRLEVAGVPVTNEVLLDLALEAVKFSIDSTHSTLSGQDFVQLMKMSHKLTDTETVLLTKDPEELLMLAGYRQFAFQEKSFNLLTRNYYLYWHLWNKVEKARDMNVLAEVEAIAGVPLNVSLVFAYAVMGNKDAHFWPWDAGIMDDFGIKLNRPLKPEDFIHWLHWVSGDFSQIVALDGSLLEPFVTYPIVDTRTKPRPELDPVYIVISHHLLQNKVTSGLYFELATRFDKGGKDNDFKSKFGYVFQEYVGQLLRFYFRSWDVLPEIRYKKAKGIFQDSVDWFLLKKDRLVMFEVKQSSIFLQAKTTANLADISRDLSRTLVAALKQLATCRADILQGSYPELAALRGARYIECVIVVSDPLYNANSIGKQLLMKQAPHVNFEFHIINISDLEVLLSNQQQSESLFDLLSYKATEKSGFDFKEYTISMFPDGNVGIPFLEPYFKEVFGPFQSTSRSGAT